jgi:hypothetical protein
MTIYYVATDGSDSADGSESTPFLTINYAISQASDSDTIEVVAGVYTDTSVAVSKELIINGPNNDLSANPDDAETRASEAFLACPITVSADNVTISGFKFTTVTGSVITCSSQSALTVSNNIMTTFTSYGINCDQITGLTISGNYIYNWTGTTMVGIYAVRSTTVSITNNYLAQFVSSHASAAGGIGISINGSAGTVSGNTVENLYPTTSPANTEYGIGMGSTTVSDPSAQIVTANTITNCGLFGILVENYNATSEIYISALTVTSNTITNHVQSAIAVMSKKGTVSITISSNTIVQDMSKQQTNTYYDDVMPAILLLCGVETRAGETGSVAVLEGNSITLTGTLPADISLTSTAILPSFCGFVDVVGFWSEVTFGGASTDGNTFVYDSALVMPDTQAVSTGEYVYKNKYLATFGSGYAIGNLPRTATITINLTNVYTDFVGALILIEPLSIELGTGEALVTVMDLVYDYSSAWSKTTYESYHLIHSYTSLYSHNLMSKIIDMMIDGGTMTSLISSTINTMILTHTNPTYYTPLTITMITSEFTVKYFYLTTATTSVSLSREHLSTDYSLTVNNYSTLRTGCGVKRLIIYLTNETFLPASLLAETTDLAVTSQFFIKPYDTDNTALTSTDFETTMIDTSIESRSSSEKPSGFLMNITASSNLEILKPFEREDGEQITWEIKIRDPSVQYLMSFRSPQSYMTDATFRDSKQRTVYLDSWKIYENSYGELVFNKLSYNTSGEQIETQRVVMGTDSSVNVIFTDWAIGESAGGDLVFSLRVVDPDTGVITYVPKSTMNTNL